ncbi:uncharacterized protein LOC118432299 [Branchiostoma floridae]|uniref:Uncharacterized protein LOC118432299 n=1 Tax=Branchiostoma floridae TaxID=7739 RepID=A0A9J7MHR4_BRAFL|nr:uncharacterized protein LOC118432299 [Branchiostoma floridae]
MTRKHLLNPRSYITNRPNGRGWRNNLYRHVVTTHGNKGHNTWIQGSYQVHIQASYTDGNGQTQNGESNVRSTASTSIRLLKSNKTEILDLLPNSVYTITVTGFTYTGEGNFSHTVNCTVPPGKPSLPGKPRRTQKPKTSSFALQIRPASERNGPVGCYHVIVIKTDKNSTEGLPEPEALQVYKTQGEAEKSDLGYAAYIAMARTSEEVKTSSDVTLGDGSVTSCKGDRTSRDLTVDDVYDEDYVNSPLTPDSFYATSVRAYGPKEDGQPSFSASQYTTPTKTAPPPPDSFLIPIIAAVCGAALLAIILSSPWSAV